MYSKTQETRAWVGLMVYGFISMIAVICFNVIAPIFEQYWGYGCAGAFYWSVGFLFTAKFYKSMTIQESNDGKSLQIFFPVVKALNPGCMTPNSLDQGVVIAFDDIICYRVHHLNPFSGCGQMTGAFADGCCGDYIPVGFTINECDGCCSKRWKYGQNMVELQLQEAITYNECGCLCAERHANIVRVSTEDLDGLVQLLKGKNVKEDLNGSPASAMKDTVALNVNIDQGDSYGNLDDKL